MTKDKALTLALEALERYQVKRQDFITFDGVIAALNEALAQPEQYTDIVSDGGLDPRNKFDAQPKREWVELTIDEFLSVFAENDAPEVSDRRNSRSAQRPWVGLTDEERSEIYNRMDWVIDFDWEYELAIEAKLKEKNA